MATARLSAASHLAAAREAGGGKAPSSAPSGAPPRQRGEGKEAVMRRVGSGGEPSDAAADGGFQAEMASDRPLQPLALDFSPLARGCRGPREGVACLSHGTFCPGRRGGWALARDFLSRSRGCVAPREGLFGPCEGVGSPSRGTFCPGGGGGRALARDFLGSACGSGAVACAVRTTGFRSATVARRATAGRQRSVGRSCAQRTLRGFA